MFTYFGPGVFAEDPTSEKNRGRPLTDFALTVEAGALLAKHMTNWLDVFKRKSGRLHMSITQWKGSKVKGLADVLAKIKSEYFIRSRSFQL